MLYVTCKECGISFKLDIPSWVSSDDDIKKFFNDLSSNGCPLCRKDNGTLYLTYLTQEDCYDCLCKYSSKIK